MAGKRGRSVGPKPGERRGGRQKGTPNRTTVEQIVEAERAAVELKRQGKKLGKEILDDFANLFAGMAAYYQPSPKNAPVQNPNQSEEKFVDYAKLAVDAAYKAADFQSPRFRAIVVQGGDDFANGKAGFPVLPAPPAGKIMGALQAYQQLRDNDLIDITPKPKAPAVAVGGNGASPPKKANGSG